MTRATARPRVGRRIVAVVLAACLASLAPLACSSDDGDPPSAGEASTSAAGPTTTTEVPTTTEEGAGQVPVDDDLVARLPELGGDAREVSTDPSFSEELCDGTVVPVVPLGQAEATHVADTTTVEVAAYRFRSPAHAAEYARLYTPAVRRCTDGEEPRVAYFGGGELFVADSDEAYGEMFTLVAGDEVWVLLARDEEVPVTLGDDLLLEVIDAAGG